MPPSKRRSAVRRRSRPSRPARHVDRNAGRGLLLEDGERPAAVTLIAPVRAETVGSNFVRPEYGALVTGMADWFRERRRRRRPDRSAARRDDAGARGRAGAGLLAGAVRDRAGQAGRVGRRGQPDRRRSEHIPLRAGGTRPALRRGRLLRARSCRGSSPTARRRPSPTGSRSAPPAARRDGADSRCPASTRASRRRQRLRGRVSHRSCRRPVWRSRRCWLRSTTTSCWTSRTGWPGDPRDLWAAADLEALRRSGLLRRPGRAPPREAAQVGHRGDQCD